MKALHGLFGVSLLVLCSCATQWTKVGFSAEQWHRDDAECVAESADLFPPRFVSRTEYGEPTPVTTECTKFDGRERCTTSGGEANYTTRTTDLNEANRSSYWRKCIRAKGYYPVGEKPARVGLSR